MGRDLQNTAWTWRLLDSAKADICVFQLVSYSTVFFHLFVCTCWIDFLVNKLLLWNGVHKEVVPIYRFSFLFTHLLKLRYTEWFWGMSQAKRSTKADGLVFEDFFYRLYMTIISSCPGCVWWLLHVFHHVNKTLILWKEPRKAGVVKNCWSLTNYHGFSKITVVHFFSW